MTPTYAPGDLVFCHSKGLIGKAIRLGEWLRFRRGSRFNHVAILDKQLINGNWTVIQAEARGVTDTGDLFSVDPGGFYEVVRLPDQCDRAKMVAFAKEQVGRRYGWVTIASIVLTILTPLPFNFLWPNTWICSAVAAESARFAGWYHPWGDIYQVMPSQLWAAIDERGLLAATRGER